MSNYSNPRYFAANNVLENCIAGVGNVTVELSPEIWIATDSLVATSFASLAILIMLIGCVISGLVCGVAIRNKALKSWLGVSYVIDFIIAVVLMSIYTPVHLYTIAQGNWTIGGDTNCERQNACIAVASVIMILIFNKEIALQCLPLDLNYFIAGESFSKRRIFWSVGFIVIFLFLFSSVLILSPLEAYYFNQDLAFCVWSLPCLLYTSPSPRDRQKSRMPSSA